jgi:hypothetical protein
MSSTLQISRDTEIRRLAKVMHKSEAELKFLSELDGAGGYLPGDPEIPEVLRPLYPVTGLLAPPNPYEVEITGLGIPILVPGQYPGSELTQ